MKKKTEKNIYQSNVVERPIRKSINMPTQLTVGDQEYRGFVINISARGVGIYINTTFNGSVLNCSKGSTLTLELQSPLGDIIEMQCTIRRLRITKSSQNDLISNIGVEVLNPPPNFMKLFESLD